MKQPHPVDIHVGLRLKQIRKMRRLSQKDLGEMVGNPITFQQLQKYERGMNRLSASRLWELSEALQVPPAYFFEGMEMEPQEDLLLPSPVMAAAHDLTGLQKPVRDNIIFIIKELAKQEMLE